MATPAIERMRAIRVGAAHGAFLGTLLFLADVSGLTLARASLFDPSTGTIALVAVAGLSSVGAATLLGALAAIAYPQRWKIPARWRRIALAMLLIGTTALAYVARRGRTLDKPGPRPAVTAQHPAPVLWVVIDTLRADTLYGPSLTMPLAPKLRGFADTALIFRDAESAAGWTVPSMASMLTGLHPSAHRAHGYLPTWAPTIAEHLRSAGYETRAIIDNGLLEPRTGYLRGFESFFQKSSMRFAHGLPGFRLLGSWPRRKLREQWPSYYGAARITDQALRELATLGNAPPFLYVHYMDPHYPYYAHEELGPDPQGLERVSLPQATLRRQGGTLRPAQLAFLKHRYEQEVAYVDGHLGRLLAAWHARFGDESLVIVTADHGEEFLEHGWLGHVRNLHTELVRVPLLLHMPVSVGVDQGGRSIADPVGQVDLVPTVLDVLGSRRATDTLEPHGISWLGWLRGVEPAPARPMLSWQDYLGARLTRWREGPWVLIEHAASDSGTTAVSLYDKYEDDAELRDVAAQFPERRDAMAARAAALFSAHADLTKLPNRAETDVEALRALGYVR